MPAVLPIIVPRADVAMIVPTGMTRFCLGMLRMERTPTEQERQESR